MSRYPTIDLEATGRQIVRLRKERGITVRDLQAYFGFDAPQAIYKWQRGQTLPSVDNLYALSRLLDVPMNTILVEANRPQRAERQDSSCRPVFLFLAQRRRRSPHKKAPRRTRQGAVNAGSRIAGRSGFLSPGGR